MWYMTPKVSEQTEECKGCAKPIFKGDLIIPVDEGRFYYCVSCALSSIAEYQQNESLTLTKISEYLNTRRG